jgi:hypothetical protein
MYSPEDYICGGYFLVKTVGRPKVISELVPETLLTISTCFTDVAPDVWAVAEYKVTDDERVAEAAKLGIPSSALPRLTRLLSEAIGSELPNAFPNLAVAEAFYAECTDKADVALLGIGLHPTLLSSAHAQRDDEVNRGYGLLERIESQRRLASGGEPLGFEPLGLDGTHFHSWLCHNAPVEALEEFGVRPNDAGFIDSFDNAVRITEHLKRTGAEPGIWEPWLIVRYVGIA